MKKKKKSCQKRVTFDYLYILSFFNINNKKKRTFFIIIRIIYLLLIINSNYYKND